MEDKELLEKVARAICLADVGYNGDYIPHSPIPSWHDYIQPAQAAISLVMERAAQVCDDEDGELSYSGQHNNMIARANALKEAAAKIRALKGD
jgi:hypothetical protein